MTPLIRATKRGDLVEVRRLLSSGADPNESSSGWTPIHMAAARGNTPILSLLLSAGAKPDSRAVQIAAFGNHAKTVRALLAAGTDVDVTGETLLLNALAWSGFTTEQQRGVRHLLEEAGARQLPGWYLRWRWSIRYGWRWRALRLLYAVGWLPRPRS
jgi:ankyrin repeat protein